MNKEDFIKKYCLKCEKICEKGIYVTNTIIKCADTGISEKKEKKF